MPWGWDVKLHELRWPTTALSRFMDVSAIVLANHLLPFPCFRVQSLRSTARSLVLDLTVA